LRVLVVDDSAFMRKVISDMIRSNPLIDAVYTAVDGLDALEKIRELKPDLVTLDVTMPRMDGLAALKRIMTEHPLPVIMLSSVTQEGAEKTFEALEYGAVDYLPKPSGPVSLDIGKIKDELMGKIKTAMHAKILPRKSLAQSSKQAKHNFKDKIIAIGASAGGPPALEAVLTRLPQDILPILIVQHMPAGFTRSFANRLDRLCSFSVKEAEEGDTITQGQTLIAPGGYHIVVTEEKRIKLDSGPSQHGVKPAVDPMMESVACVYTDATIGVILTGMGRDGVSGMQAIKKHGGVTIAQDEASSAIFGMPKAVIDEGYADMILSLERIPEQLVNLCLA
jgi:two-component system chemotaxis response regulator CheB